jgi:uncharacterized protein YlxW (UPF0749 family)
MALQSRMRQQAEDEIIHLKATLQEVQKDQKELEQRVRESESDVDHYRRIVMRYCEGLNKVLPVLEELRPELPLGNHHDMSFAVMSNESLQFSQHQW